MIAPTLHTTRYTLRAHEAADFATYRDVFASDHTQFMGGPTTELQSWAMFCKDVAQWALLGHGAWAVTKTDGGDFLGQIGINKHPYFPEVELGWIVLPTAARQGVGFEAAQRIKSWAFETLNLETLVSYIHQDNAASIALARKLGAALDPTAPTCPYDNHVVYRHPQPEAHT